jgi:hypothetical protein
MSLIQFNLESQICSLYNNLTFILSKKKLLMSTFEYFFHSVSWLTLWPAHKSKLVWVNLRMDYLREKFLVLTVVFYSFLLIWFALSPVINDMGIRTSSWFEHGTFISILFKFLTATNITLIKSKICFSGEWCIKIYF